MGGPGFQPRGRSISQSLVRCYSDFNLLCSCRIRFTNRRRRLTIFHPREACCSYEIWKRSTLIKEEMEESVAGREKSLAAPTIFVLVLGFHIVSKYLELNKKKKGSMSEADVQLRAEIKQLLKEAGSLTQPSTFAQAPKLRRMVAAKEKELAKNQEMHGKDIKMAFGPYEKLLMISKVVTYVLLILWFWHMPVATISGQLVQPFGRFQIQELS